VGNGTAVDPTDERDERTRLLSIYLRDHRAGAEAGLRLVQRARRHHPAGDLASMLGEIEREIAEDRDSLDALMERFGVGRSTPKELAAIATEWLGRLKLNGRTVNRSALSPVLELEALTAGVTMKRRLWHSLLAVTPENRAELVELIGRADSQLLRLEQAHERAAVVAFGRASAARQTGGTINDTEARYGDSEAPA
jgi:hypothetical protein